MDFYWMFTLAAKHSDIKKMIEMKVLAGPLRSYARGAYAIAAYQANWVVLYWLINNGYPADSLILEFAAEAGQLKVIKFFNARGILCNSNVYHIAKEHNNQRLLRYIHDYQPHIVNNCNDYCTFCKIRQFKSINSLLSKYHCKKLFNYLIITK